MIENTVSHIFLVILTIGYNCCDRMERTLRAFSDKRDAERYMSDMQRQIAYNMGLRHAVDHMMGEMWDKEHPSPPYPDYNADLSIEDYNARRDVYYAHSDLRCKEVDRLLALVGWKKELDTYHEEEYHLHIQEVPFGVEVVTPPTEVRASPFLFAYIAYISLQSLQGSHLSPPCRTTD
jgi:hypothetical protein